MNSSLMAMRLYWHAANSWFEKKRSFHFLDYCQSSLLQIIALTDFVRHCGVWYTFTQAVSIFDAAAALPFSSRRRVALVNISNRRRQLCWLHYCALIQRSVEKGGEDIRGDRKGDQAGDFSRRTVSNVQYEEAFLSFRCGRSVYELAAIYKCIHCQKVRTCIQGKGRITSPRISVIVCLFRPFPVNRWAATLRTAASTQATSFYRESLRICSGCCLLPSSS
jgi:hypothetical protein